MDSKIDQEFEEDSLEEAPKFKTAQKALVESQESSSIVDEVIDDRTDDENDDDESVITSQALKDANKVEKGGLWLFCAVLCLLL